MLMTLSQISRLGPLTFIAGRQLGQQASSGGTYLGDEGRAHLVNLLNTRQSGQVDANPGTIEVRYRAYPDLPADFVDRGSFDLRLKLDGQGLAMPLMNFGDVAENVELLCEALVSEEQSVGSADCRVSVRDCTSGPADAR